MAYRVLIPAAGTGSRLGGLTRHLNKALVSVANRPAISHIIDSFSRDAEFVIALGYKGGLVREFLRLAYPEHKFHFVEVRPFEGPGSGLGLSVLSCMEHLRQPFIFVSCDTLVKGEIPPPDGNWAGWAEAADLTPYRTLELRNGTVADICEKGTGRPGSHKPYIGLTGIRDHAEFWEAMLSGGAEAVAEGEAWGLRALTGRGMEARRFDWHDTGTPEGLAQARAAYAGPGAPNILEKSNEAIWFTGGRVIKFSDDITFIAERVKRAAALGGFVPEVSASTPHMYRYPMASGRIMSEAVTLPLFKKLLDRSVELWTPARLAPAEEKSFHSSCMRFYRKKTLERVALFHKVTGKADGTEKINGASVPTLGELLNEVDWESLSRGLPGRFHGDFHFENILYSENDDRFVFLDWRQNFGGSLEIGDIYYDLAKLLHGLIICHELIARGLYSVDWTERSIGFDFRRKPILEECENYFMEWLGRCGYDPGKVRLLTALIYLNIAALHHFPYSLLLFALGKSMLHAETENTA